ncbi:MAG: HAMP domain-containing protein [Deltaproteobacteria bacterium]|nr:HAMP domain-containing protein [Deltaproteobacteria bacterium]
MIGVISVFTAIGMGVILYAIRIEILDRSKKNALLDDIVIGIMDLRALTYDYLLHPEERSRQQWYMKHASLSNLFGRFDHLAAENREAANAILRNHNHLETLFSQLMENAGARSPVGKTSRDLLAGQMLTRSQAMISDAFRSIRRNRGALIAWQETYSKVFFSVAVLSVSLLAGVSFLLGRQIIRSLSKLQAGTDRIAGGDLDFRLIARERNEIGDLSRAFDRMAERLKALRDALRKNMAELESSNKDLEQFAYVASHDLQEPLRMVASYVKLLERRYKGKLDKDADEFIAFAVDGAERMQKMIDDLLTFSRVGTRGRTFGPTDAGAAMEQALENLQLFVKEKGASVTRDPLPVVLADGSQMVQLFQNLIGNAVKFHGNRPPCVHVSANKRDGEWVFSVRDNGIGIEPEYGDRIFRVFQRLHDRETYPGTGIGLAICRKIAERHGGRIWVESKAGEGSTFRFTIPTV